MPAQPGSPPQLFLSWKAVSTAELPAPVPQYLPWLFHSEAKKWGWYIRHCPKLSLNKSPIMWGGLLSSLHRGSRLRVQSHTAKGRTKIAHQMGHLLPRPQGPQPVGRQLAGSGHPKAGHLYNPWFSHTESCHFQGTLYHAWIQHNEWRRGSPKFILQVSVCPQSWLWHLLWNWWKYYLPHRMAVVRIYMI